MATRKKERGAPAHQSGEAAPLRGTLDLPFITAQEFVKEAERAGLTLSEKGAARMKTPQLLVRGKDERCEFFDLDSRPPKERQEDDSPSTCFDKRLPPPEWISNWYLSVTEKDGQKSVTFVYPPKKVFVKCAVAEAEKTILSAMRQNSLGQ